MSKKKSYKERRDADRRVRQCERLARLMQVLHLIGGKGRWNVTALAEELECSTRTIHRLLQTLSIAGVPWYFDEKIKAYKIRPGYKFPLLGDPTLASEKNDNMPEELDELADKLIQDGESFIKSLKEFLNALKSTTGHK